MRESAFFAAIITLASTSVAGAAASDAPGYTPGPWHFRSVSCVDTTIKDVGPRLAIGQAPYPPSAFASSGVAVSFATGLGLKPIFNENAAVVHYQNEPGNDAMAAEKAGDKVQLCFLGGPPPTIGCDPDKDDRGRQYRVWDYAQKVQYVGDNAEHGCGGA